MSCSRVTISLLLAALGGTMIALGPGSLRQGMATDIGQSAAGPAAYGPSEPAQAGCNAGQDADYTYGYGKYCPPGDYEPSYDPSDEYSNDYSSDYGDEPGAEAAADDDADYSYDYGDYEADYEGDHEGDYEGDHEGDYEADYTYDYGDYDPAADDESSYDYSDQYGDDYGDQYADQYDDEAEADSAGGGDEVEYIYEYAGYDPAYQSSEEADAAGSDQDELTYRGTGRAYRYVEVEPEYEYEYQYEYTCPEEKYGGTRGPEAEVSYPGRPELFTWSPGELLDAADQDALRTLASLGEEPPAVRREAFYEYLKGLGVEAIDFALRFEQVTGEAVLELGARPSSAAAMLATYRLVERGDLTMAEAVEVLEHALQNLPEHWSDEVTRITTEQAEWFGNPPAERKIADVLASLVSDWLGELSGRFRSVLERLSSVDWQLLSAGMSDDQPAYGPSGNWDRF